MREAALGGALDGLARGRSPRPRPSRSGRSAGTTGRCRPRPSAPKIASVSACRPTSASEWPTRPRSNGMAHAAERDAVAGAEGVHVEAVAGRGCPCAPPMRARPLEVGGGGDLEVRLVARNDARPQARRRGRPRRRRPPRRRGPGARRGSRRSGSPAASARARGRRAAPAPSRAPPAARQSASTTGSAGKAAGAVVERAEHRVDHRAAPRTGGRRRGSAPGRAPSAASASSPARTEPARVSAPGAPAAAAAGRRSRRRRVVARPIVGVDHHLDRVDAGCASSASTARPSTRPRAEVEILLRDRVAEPGAPAGRHDQACRPHRPFPLALPAHIRRRRPTHNRRSSG